MLSFIPPLILLISSSTLLLHGVTPTPDVAISDNLLTFVQFKSLTIILSLGVATDKLQTIQDCRYFQTHFSLAIRNKQDK